MDYYFGQALRNSCYNGSPLYYEGLYWMNLSLFLEVKFPDEKQSFNDFANYYINKVYKNDEYYISDGFVYIRNIVLAPSQEMWDTFVKDKLSLVTISPLESYLLDYDLNEIAYLIKEYKVEVWSSGWRDSLSISINGEEVGKISIQQDSLTLNKTFTHDKIQKIIGFSEDLMKKTGSSKNVSSWLKKIDSTGL